MSLPQTPAGLSELAPDYDAILCDVWGVIHNGREAFVDACAALERYRAERGPVVLISNSPRPSDALHGQLAGFGVPRAAWTTFVTSGDATRPFLAARAPGPVWTIGPRNRDGPLYDGLGLDFVDQPQDAAFIACTGPDDEETEQAEDYRARLQTGVARELQFICANPDRVVQKGDRLIPCAGAIADLYEDLGGWAIRPGKPNAPIYDLAIDEAQRALGRPVDRQRILCIGDGVTTDVRGAEAQGLDCLFLWGGIHAAELSHAEGARAAEPVAEFLTGHATTAKYAMPELVW